MDPLKKLPVEICEQIFRYLSEEKDILSAMNVSRTWSEFLSSRESVWKALCQKCCLSEIVREDRKEGHTWREIYHRTTSKEGTKRLWMEGHLAKVRSFDSLPAHQMCPMGLQDWGNILDELHRQ